jgi:hypothetical protein
VVVTAGNGNLNVVAAIIGCTLLPGQREDSVR